MSVAPNSPIADALLPRERLLVAVERDIEDSLRIAREFGLGAEVQTFAWPDKLNGDCAQEVRRMARELETIDGPIGCHGPFIDTLHFSLDEEIQRVSRKRYLDALDIASRLRASYVIFHSQYNPLIKIPTYADLYHERSLAFWPEIIAAAERAGICLYIENMFDDSPEPLRRLAEAVASPRFQVCLDAAHAFLHSDQGFEAWILALGPYLQHVHLSDCHGIYDDHIALGEGRLDLGRLFHLLKGFPARYTLETGIHTPASLRFLGVGRLVRAKQH